MKYIGIVNKIRDDHESGFYGRAPVTDEKANELLEEASNSFGWAEALKVGLTVASFSPVIGTFARIVALVGAGTIKTNNNVVKERIEKAITSKFRKKNSFKLQRQIDGTDKKILVFNEDSFDNDYKIDNKYLYGLFDNVGSLKTRSKVLKTLFTSKGGSQLDIVERGDLPDNIQHLNKGHFSEGIYIFHPKNENILIPLQGSNELIQSLILEETVRAFEALGAKKITINDITQINSSTKVKAKKVDVDITSKYDKTILREKRFGKGVFNPERAIQNKYFIQDIPSVMTTIEGRKSGNQLEEKFSETISLNLGMDIEMLDAFNANTNLSYLREWFFHIEFYDKNEM